jgi:hypothetical protein
MHKEQNLLTTAYKFISAFSCFKTFLFLHKDIGTECSRIHNPSYKQQNCAVYVYCIITDYNIFLFIRIYDAFSMLSMAEIIQCRIID